MKPLSRIALLTVVLTAPVISIAQAKDTTHPVLTISADRAKLTTSQTVQLTFSMSEGVQNFDRHDVVVSSGSISNFVKHSASRYTATFRPSRSGTVSVKVAARTFSDFSWNQNLSPSQLELNVINPNSIPAAYRRAFYRANNTAWYAAKEEKNATLKALYYQIAATPVAAWHDGKGTSDTRLRNYVNAAKARNETPQIVLYGIPYRDCGSYSAGGQPDASSYRSWINRVSGIVGNTPAVVIVEPDAINYCGWKPTDARYKERASLLTYVGTTFAKNNPNAVLYIHAGSAQLSQSGAADAVIAGGIKHMRGFALNISGHRGTARLEAWGEQFVKTLAARGVSGKYYVLDTSRNGVDSPAKSNANAPYNSCNNFNAALGRRPTTETTGAFADAYIWAKVPAESDGACGANGPAAGQWYPALAKVLVERALQLGTISRWNVPNGF